MRRPERWGLGRWRDRLREIVSGGTEGVRPEEPEGRPLEEEGGSQGPGQGCLLPGSSGQVTV